MLRYRIPRSSWAVKPGAFAAIIDAHQFEQVQNWLRYRREPIPPTTMLRKLKRLLAKKGTLSTALIDSTRGMPNAHLYWLRFGSLRRAYELIGYKCQKVRYVRSEHVCSTVKLMNELVATIQYAFPGKVASFGGRWKKKAIMILDSGLPVAIAPCRRYWTRKGATRWLLRAVPTERNCIVLVCLMDEKNERFEDLYLLPGLGEAVRKFKWLKPNDLYFDRGVKLTHSSNFYSLVCDLARGSNNRSGVLFSVQPARAESRN